MAPVTKAPVVDATGAGDQYAAGVLYGITHGLSLVESARLGNLAAGDSIRVLAEDGAWLQVKTPSSEIGWVYSTIKKRP